MASRWSVLLEPRAAIELNAIEDRDTWEDALALLGELTEGPAASACIPLERYQGYWRGRIAGNFRVVYRVSDKQKRIVITRVRHRSTAYEGL